MSMRPEVAASNLRIGPYDGGEPGELEFSVHVSGVGWGICTARLDESGVWEIGHLFADPQRIGIGTKIVETMKQYIGSAPFKSDVLHEPTLRQLRAEIMQVRKTGDTMVIEDRRKLKRLKIVGYVQRLGIQTDKLVITYDPIQYSGSPLIVTIYGKL